VLFVPEISFAPAADLHACVTFSQLLVGAERLLDLTFAQMPGRARRGRRRGGGGEEEHFKSWADRVLEKRERMARRAGGGAAYRVPRKDDLVVGWCRECGGPVAAADSWADAGARCDLRRMYGDTWRDEGLIAWKQSTCVCGACRTLKQGKDRSWSNPGDGEALLVFPGVGMKLELRQALEKIRGGEVETPFCLVVGNAKRRANSQHLYRFVPVNWSLADRVDAYRARVGEYSPLAFRVRPVLAFVEEWAASGQGRGFAELYKAAGEKKLTASERLVARLVLFGRGGAGQEQSDLDD
jgi:hypothetical protein